MDSKPPPMGMKRQGYYYVRLPLSAGYDELLIDQRIQSGSPCIRGTRIPVHSIYGRYRGGDTIEYMMKDWRLTREIIQAAIDYAEGK